MAEPTYTAAEIIRFIEASGKDGNVDAKAAMTWDGQAASAGLAKDIVAFANSRDGGVIVLGKSERSPGTSVLDGVSDQQAASFDTTKVGDWINSRFAPPVRVVCHRHVHQGKTFIVIAVGEFVDIPHICTKSFQDPADGKKILLKEGGIYVRQGRAASTPLRSESDLRTLVGLATGKRAHEMLAVFERMLPGRPIVPPTNDNELFTKELDEIQTGLEVTKEALKAGAWTLRVHPGIYRVERWASVGELRQVIERRSVRLRSEFPPHFQTHTREWGIASDVYNGRWALAHSGQFYYFRPLWENEQDYKSPWVGTNGRDQAEADAWHDFKPSIYEIAELFIFLMRFVEEYGPGEKVDFEIRATGLSGRRLVTTDPRIHIWDTKESCRADVYDFKRSLTVEELKAEGEEICAAAMKRLMDLFPDTSIEIGTMRQWLKAFKERKY